MNMRPADSFLTDLCASIPPADAATAAATRQRLDSLTKPRGSLGQLEALIIRLAASTAQVCPCLDQRAVLLCAADHGVAAEGVSAYPQTVTGQMVQNFLAGGAAINVLAQTAGARIILVDAGVAADLPEHPHLQRLHIRRGSGNIAHEPALSHDETLAAVQAGAALVAAEAAHGLDILLTGEMGIANTTPAAALTSALVDAPPAQTVGRGTGIDAPTLAHKQQVVGRALARVMGSASRWAGDPLHLLAELGGLEIATLTGAILAAAARRIPILLDGYITTSAALVAAALAPNVRVHLFASHQSAEPGHALALAALGLTAEAGAGPLLRLDLRLGEGSGAALALPLLVAATRLLHDMATFEQAGVDQ
ncbi:MAG: nicotinate-nucleotide--dimethylbenzimidazole phosphoribosyltransferase [Chloroflexaceae bacterium]|nr:nicotinate-nucleotide--dimethylbenzimidazole phosphoribosyltransferase [Chloroflexaceae bacterium]